MYKFCNVAAVSTSSYDEGTGSFYLQNKIKSKLGNYDPSGLTKAEDLMLSILRSQGLN